MAISRPGRIGRTGINLFCLRIRENEINKIQEERGENWQNIAHMLLRNLLSGRS
jgi:hypothetical protein